MEFSVHSLWQTLDGESYGSRWLSAYPCLAHGLAPPCVSSGLPGDFWRSVSSCNLHRKRSRDPDCLLSLLSLQKGFYCEDHWEGSWGSCWWLSWQVAGLLMASLLVNAALYSGTQPGAPNHLEIMTCGELVSSLRWFIKFIYWAYLVKLFQCASHPWE